MHLPFVDRWAVDSQLQSRRNAMLASTRLTQRRAEASDVADYLAARGVDASALRARVDAPARGTGAAGPVTVAR